MLGSRLVVVLLCISVLSVPACVEPDSQPRPRPAPAPSVTATASPEATMDPDATSTFAFDAPVPNGPRKLAAELTFVSRDLLRAIDEWRALRSPPGPHARAVALRAVRQQRLYRKLLDRSRVAARTLDLLPRRLRRIAATAVEAGRGLRSLVTPLDDIPDWEITKPAPPRELLRYYREGERRFDVPWEILASINFVESRFGRILGPSSAGAQGPMQFIPSTWAAYGNGGDIMDPYDSIIGAARYLSASGAPERMNDALFAYNRSEAYVNAISIYARHMMDDPRHFYGYYFWQVFVLTTEGDVQLSGPGRP